MQLPSWKQKAVKLIAFSGLQTLVHGVMALSGFLIVRTLDKPEYAAYTIAASLQTLLSALTDCGIGAGLNAVGGRIWTNSARLRGLIAVALRFRFALAIVAVPMTVGSAFYLLRKNGVAWANTVALTTGVIATMFGVFLTAVYVVPLRLRSLYTTVQKFDLLAACVRFALLALFAFFFLNAITAVLVTAVTLALQGLLLRGSVERVLQEEPREEEADRHALVGLMKKQFFATLFFAYQGQITVWIISIFGSTDKVADVGALSRLAILFALIGSVLSGIVSPTYARCESLGRLLRLFGFAVAVYTVLALALIGCSIVFPGELLWVLGGKYSFLTNEVFWIVANCVVGGYIWVIHSLALARGWVWQSWFIPIFTLAVQAAVLPFMHLSSVRGVLILGLWTSLPTLLTATYMVARGLWTSWRNGALTSVAT